MKLPINIEELLGGKAAENDRIEYKTEWNPDAIQISEHQEKILFNE